MEVGAEGDYTPIATGLIYLSLQGLLGTERRGKGVCRLGQREIIYLSL